MTKEEKSQYKKELDLQPESQNIVSQEYIEDFKFRMLWRAIVGRSDYEKYGNESDGRKKKRKILEFVHNTVYLIVVIAFCFAISFFFSNVFNL